MRIAATPPLSRTGNVMWPGSRTSLGEFTTLICPPFVTSVPGIPNQVWLSLSTAIRSKLKHRRVTRNSMRDRCCAVGVPTGEVGERAGAFDEPYIGAAAGNVMSERLCHMGFRHARGRRG